MIKRTIYFGNPAYLSLRNSQLVFRLIDTPDFRIVSERDVAEARSIPIEDIGILVIDNKQITITQGALAALLENNVSVLVCDSCHMPHGMLLPLSGNILQSERFRKQIDCSVPLRKQLWQQTVKCKILNQAQVLKKYRDTEVGNMIAWSRDVKSNDTANLEGRAAAYYWKEMFDNDFTRERGGDWPNNFLNYGYAILRAVVARALVCKGLLPTLGIHHKNRYNAYCLADDIMEPYRPVVDALVLEIMEKYPNESNLSKTIKKELLAIPVKEVYIDGHRSPLMVAVGITANSLLKCFEGKDKLLTYPSL